MTTTNIGAGAILDSTKKIVCQERTHQHGDTVESFKVIADFWTIYLSGVNHNPQVRLTPTDVAEMMSLLKKVRYMFGDKTNGENFIDDAGYVALAGMFAGIKPAQQDLFTAANHPITMKVDPNSQLIDVRDLENKMRRAAE